MVSDIWLSSLIDIFRPDAMLREVSATLFITAHAKITDTLLIEGSVDMLTLPVQEILHRSHKASARQILLIHTHPSGDPRPSPQDIAVTRRLCQHLRRQHLRMMDHIILTQDQYFSFRAHRLL